MFGLIFSDFASFFSLFELIIGAKMVFKVTLGCTVSGRVGPLVYAHPNAKKRTRTLYYGTVVETIPNNLWRVFWHDLQLTSNHRPKELGFISARKDNCSDEELKVLSNSVQFIGDKVDLTSYVDAKLPQDNVIPRQKSATTNTISVTVDDHTNASTVGTEVNSQVLLPPHPRAAIGAGRSTVTNATPATSNVTTDTIAE